MGKSKIKCSKIPNSVRLKKIDWLLKFIFDFGLAVPALFLTSPLLLLCAIAVKLDSSGPIIYRRRVMGLDCQQFDAFKFRPMYVNGDEILKPHPLLQAELSQNHKLKHDPRVTRVGRFLRKYSLDELPQLANVLRQDMSVIGPRMISPEEMGKYDQWYASLLSVKPGITGLWQVSGRSDVSYNERICLDMYYIQNWSIWLDLLLLFRTIPAVIKGQGAY